MPWLVLGALLIGGIGGLGLSVRGTTWTAYLGFGWFLLWFLVLGFSKWLHASVPLLIVIDEHKFSLTRERTGERTDIWFRDLAYFQLIHGKGSIDLRLKPKVGKAVIVPYRHSSQHASFQAMVAALDQAVRHYEPAPGVQQPQRREFSWLEHPSATVVLVGGALLVAWQIWKLGLSTSFLKEYPGLLLLDLFFLIYSIAWYGTRAERRSY